MVAKEVKLMALTEGIRIQQFLDVWLMRADLNQQYQVNSHRLVSSCLKPGLDDKFKKKKNLKKSNFWLQFDLRVGLVFPTENKLIVFSKTQFPC